MDNNMRHDFEIKANMNLINNTSSDLVAVGEVIIADYFVMHNVKVLNLGQEGEKKMRVLLPNRQNPKTGKWEDVIKVPDHIQKQIEQAVIRDLGIKIKSSVSGIKEYLEVNIFLSKKEYWPTVGYATIKVNGAFEISKVRIVDNQKGGLEVKYPIAKSGAGKYVKLFGGVSSDHEYQMDRIIIEEFNCVYKKERRENYVPQEFPKKPIGSQGQSAPEQNPVCKGGMKL